MHTTFLCIENGRAEHQFCKINTYDKSELRTICLFYHEINTNRHFLSQIHNKQLD